MPTYDITLLPEYMVARISPEPTSGCWLWMGVVDHDGYAQISGNPVQKAHRVSYKTLVGPLTNGLHIDHLCRIRCCVNPAHLEEVTPAENVRRGNSAKFRTPEHRKKIGLAHTGRKKSQDHKDKLRDSLLRYYSEKGGC